MELTRIHQMYYESQCTTLALHLGASAGVEVQIETSMSVVSFG